MCGPSGCYNGNISILYTACAMSDCFIKQYTEGFIFRCINLMDHPVWCLYVCIGKTDKVTLVLLLLSAEEMRLVMAVGTADELEVVTTSDTLMFANSSSTKSIEVTSGVP